MSKEVILKNLESNNIKSFNDLNEDELKSFYKIYLKTHKTVVNQSVKKTKKVATENNVIDKNSTKYKILLKFTNKLLVNMGKPCITDLTDFKNIDRLDLLIDKNTKTLEDMGDCI